jgi:hypothetical protein
MDIPNWTVAIGTAAGVIVSVWAGITAARKESERYSREQSREKEEFKLALAVWQTKIQFMVDELWASQGRRGKTAAVVSGLGEMHSPLKATEKGRKMFAAIMPDVESWYRLEGHGLDEAMLRAKLESLFGDIIMHDICVPNGLLHAECIEVVVAIVKEDYQKEHGPEQAQLTAA